MAYLNAVPKPPAGSKRAKAANPVEQVSRLASLKARKIEPPMPPNPLPHIVERLVEIGLSEAAGMGVGPIGWTTIVAWQIASGVRLSPWEARLIRQLSIDYVSEGRRPESENAPPPWNAPITEREMSVQDAELRALFN